MLKKALVLLFSLSIVSCTQPGTPNNTTNQQQEEKVFTETNKDITTTENSEFVIKLESNATTGYKWDLSNTPDATIIQKVSSEYIEANSSLVGAGSHELWKFKALKKGSTEIKMKYFRSFEEGTPPAKEVTFQVKVN